MEFAIGTDIEEISRFENRTIEADRKFLEKIFTKNELEYCFKKGKPSQSLCARYCAKEAVVKALSDFNITDVYYSDIEIINDKNENPKCFVSKYPDCDVKISLTHCKTYACANAFVIKSIEK